MCPLGRRLVRGARCATIAAARDARPVTDMAVELSYDWHTARRPPRSSGKALLAADGDCLSPEEPLALDETLFRCCGRRCTRPTPTLASPTYQVRGRRFTGALHSLHLATLTPR